jgi:hypothetical protein
MRNRVILTRFWFQILCFVDIVLDPVPYIIFRKLYIKIYITLIFIETIGNRLIFNLELFILFSFSDSLSN